MNHPTNLSARPTLEALEDRTVPSYLAAEFPGQGVWRYYFNGSSGSWQQLSTKDASQVAADGGGEVVAEFPGQGLWLCDGGYQWHQLTANNSASFNVQRSFTYDQFHNVYAVTTVVAEFPGQGLWKYTSSDGPSSQRPTTGWVELTSNNASTEAVNGGGTVVAEFPGWGVWLCNPDNSWQQLTAANASSVAISGDIGTAFSVVAEFPGYGVWSWNEIPSYGWQHLTASDATTVAIYGNGVVVASFPGYGVWRYSDPGTIYPPNYNANWSQLTAADAGMVGIDPNGVVFGQFPGWGIWMDNAGTWQCLTTNNPSSIGVANSTSLF
jgi:hypothetical protein